MNKYLKEHKELMRSKEAQMEAETAINDEVRQYKLDYAELSPLMRELLAKVYIRGGLEIYKKIKIEWSHVQQRSNNQKSP